jgi:replicative DNA helicase
MVQAIHEARHRQSRVGPRVPPHDLQAEESLLGAMLLSRDAIVEAVQVCSADDFYKPAHGHIFEAICALYSQGEPADTVTVADELRRAGVLDAIGGPAALISLEANTPATSNAHRFARIVEEHALLRRLIGVAGQIADFSYDVPEDVEAAVDRAESMVFEVAQRRVTTTTRPLRDLLADQLDRLESLYERGEAITGVPTGYTDLDEKLAGLQPSNLVIVGARPSQGKTSFALGIASHAAIEAATPVLIFSLEMSHLEITQRLLCAEARVDATRMRNGRLLDADWPKISHAIGRLGEAPIYIDDNPNITVMDIRAKARRQKAREGLGLVIVDYLQLMSGRAGAENRQVEISEVSRSLKILARELEVPVIALSQLSRNVEMRSDKRPMLADLRESGCLTADTKVLRADSGSEVTMGQLLLSNERNIPVWSLDQGLRMVPSVMTRVFPSGTKAVFELRLASGRSVTASANHPFLTSEGWKRLDELQVGDRVAVPRHVPQPRATISWPRDEIVMLAHLTGEGGSTSRPPLHYRSPHEANVEAVEKAATHFGVVTRRVRQNFWWHVYLRAPFRSAFPGDHPIAAWLERLGLHGLRRHERFVPAEVFALPNDQLALFLHHLWATDGKVQLNPGASLPDIRYRSTSRRMAEAVQSLLGRFGVLSRMKAVARGPHRPAYELSVPGPENQLRFLRSIGSDRAEEAHVRCMVAQLSMDRADGDGLPFGPAHFGPSDVHGDAIVSIEARGRQPVYDATVAETHNFVANGITVENSIEQDADVVMFIYREELYNPDTADRGTAEILLAKHRNGPTGKTELAFLSQYTRFANMARV